MGERCAVCGRADLLKHRIVPEHISFRDWRDPHTGQPRDPGSLPLQPLRELRVNRGESLCPEHYAEKYHG